MTKENLSRPQSKEKLLWVLGDFYRILIAGKDTDGKYILLEITSPPQGGLPLHEHSREDESFYVIDGEYQFQYGDETIRATSGFHVYLKRPIPHAFKNIGGRAGRVLVVLAPAGLEGLFEEIGTPVEDVSSFTPPSDPPDMAKIEEILKNYGVKLKQ